MQSAMPLSLRALALLAVEVVFVDAFAPSATVQILQTVQADHLEVSQRVVTLQVEQFVTALLQLHTELDDSGRVFVVHPQVIEKCDRSLAMHCGLNRSISTIKSVLSEPKKT